MDKPKFLRLKEEGEFIEDDNNIPYGYYNYEFELKEDLENGK